MKRDSLYLYIIPIACVVLLLVFTLRLYTFAYFWLDDFNNLYWVQTQSFSQMVGCGQSCVRLLSARRHVLVLGRVAAL